MRATLVFNRLIQFSIQWKIWLWLSTGIQKRNSFASSFCKFFLENSKKQWLYLVQLIQQYTKQWVKGFSAFPLIFTNEEFITNSTLNTVSLTCFFFDNYKGTMTNKEPCLRSIKYLRYSLLAKLCNYFHNKAWSHMFFRVPNRSSHWRCSIKKLFLKIPQYSRENYSVGDSF